MDKQKILLIDDNASFRSTVREFLELQGYVVLEAGDTTTAISIVESQDLALVIIDIRLVNNDDEDDLSGLILAKQLPSDLPKVMLTAYPTYQAVREALGPALNDVPPAVGFIAKQEGLHALLTAVRLALARLPSSLQQNVLKAFHATALPALREQLVHLDAEELAQRLKIALDSSEAELANQRMAALQDVARLHKFGLIARSLSLLLLTITILLLFFGLISYGAVSVIGTALAKCFDLWWGKHEEQARQRADKLYDELRRTKQGEHLLLISGLLEDPRARDECRKRIIEHILSQRY
ncbi:MAG: response regulator [Blastocatellales bacterium]